MFPSSNAILQCALLVKSKVRIFQKKFHRKNNRVFRLEDIEAQNDNRNENQTSNNTSVQNTKPPDYFEDLPPTYEEAMKVKLQEEENSVSNFLITDFNFGLVLH